MGSAWLKNFVGLKQSDFELLRVPYPKIEYGIHVTIRSVQMGTIIGSLLGPIVTIFRSDKSLNNFDRNEIKNAFVEGGINGALFGVLAAPFITYLMVRDYGKIKSYDRCYRMRFDSEQLLQDRSCVLGAGIGLLSSGSLGFVVGVDLALLASKLISTSF